MTDLVLRPLSARDRDLLFAWRNQPYIVERSSSRRPVIREEHERWFAGILDSGHSLGFIVEVAGEPIGHVRFDRQAGHECLITVYLLEKWAGRGLGVAAIRSGCQSACREWPGTSVIANVRRENTAGQSAFRKAGFTAAPACEVPDHVAFAFECRNGDDAEVRRTIAQFQSLHEKHGDSHLALNWGSQRGQHLRFNVLAAVGDLSGKTVLDVGCGLGHFADWLDERGIDAAYTGIDVTAALVEAARKRHPQREFLVGDIVAGDILRGRQFDFVLASGIFYTYRDGAFGWQKKAIAAMWSLAASGLAFNSLSNWASDQEAGEYYADPAQTLDFCRSLTPWVTLRHDYHPRDFAVYLLREPRA